MIFRMYDGNGNVEVYTCTEVVDQGNVKGVIKGDGKRWFTLYGVSQIVKKDAPNTKAGYQIDNESFMAVIKIYSNELYSTDPNNRTVDIMIG